MKPSEIRELSLEEMQRKLAESKEALFNLRFQHAVGQLENPARLKQSKRDIARLQTVINEVQRKAANSSQLQRYVQP